MAKASRFAALAEFRQAQEPQDEASTSPEAAPIAAEPAAENISTAAVPTNVSENFSPTSEPPRGRGRPPGKRSDPAWKLYSHFLKRKTQREAAALLLDRDDGRDLSDVLQGLLEGWLADEKRTGA